MPREGVLISCVFENKNKTWHREKNRSYNYDAERIFKSKAYFSSTVLVLTWWHTERCPVIKRGFKAGAWIWHSTGATAAYPVPRAPQWAADHFVSNQCLALEIKKGLLACDQIILTNVIQWLPPKESICQPSCNLLVPVCAVGMHFPKILHDITKADFHLTVIARVAAHSLTWCKLKSLALKLIK